MNIPAPLVTSQGPFAVSVSLLTRNPGGAASVTSGPFSLTALVHGITEGFRITLDNIKPISALGANNVRTDVDFDLEVEELIQSDARSVLAGLVLGDTTPYFQVVVLAGLDTITYYGTPSDAPRAPANEGGSTYKVTFKRIETGTFNPDIT